MKILDKWVEIYSANHIKVLKINKLYKNISINVNTNL